MSNKRSYKGGLDRARWLADLASALAEARKIAADLPAAPDNACEVTALRARLAHAMAEVDALRRGARWPIDEQLGPKRVKPNAQLPGRPR